MSLSAHLQPESTLHQLLARGIKYDVQGVSEAVQQLLFLINRWIPNRFLKAYQLEEFICPMKISVYRVLLILRNNNSHLPRNNCLIHDVVLYIILCDSVVLGPTVAIVASLWTVDGIFSRLSSAHFWGDIWAIVCCRWGIRTCYYAWGGHYNCSHRHTSATARSQTLTRSAESTRQWAVLFALCKTVTVSPVLVGFTATRCQYFTVNA